jgi:hypothetical protein
MTQPLTGGCVCGAVRYTCTAPPEERQMFRCHCRDCQHVSGGPYCAVVYVPAATFAVTRGKIRHHTTPSAMGGLHKRGFCADCGTRLTGGETPGEVSTHLGFTASSLDDPTVFRPSLDMWTAEAQPWDVPDPQTPRFPGPPHS